MHSYTAPLYSRLMERFRHAPVSFHIPGHHFGRALPDEPFAAFRSIMEIDVTELDDTDDLHDPEGVINEAQRLAARCFQADETFFLVGGSTAGNIAMVLAACNPGDVIIVQRNVHKSILNGIALAKARAVFVHPQQEPASGLPTVPRLDDIEAALKMYPDAKAVFLSTPNYYGMHVDLTPYAECIHRRGLPLLVDEAHGAHYGLHPACPPSAMQSGADAAVQSTHKTLTAMTMGSMLHVRRGRLSLDRIRRALAVVQSSSPSYPILASLDIARAMVDAYGPEWFNRGMQAAERVREKIASWNGPFAVVQPAHGEACSAVDPMRVVMQDVSGTFSGVELQQRLAGEGCWAEMADDRYVVLLFGPGSSGSDADKLLSALERIAAQIDGCRKTDADGLQPQPATVKFAAGRASNMQPSSAMPNRISEPAEIPLMPPDEDETAAIPLEDAAGRTAAETVLPYPPGIPLIYPGETIDEMQLAAIRRLAAAGARFQGAHDPAMRSIRVMVDSDRTKGTDR